MIDQLDKYLAYLAVFFAAYTLFRHLVEGHFAERETKSRLGLRTKKRIDNAPVFNLFYPLIEVLSLRLRKSSWPFLQTFRAGTSRRILLAGLDEKLAVEEFWAFQILTSLAFTLPMGFLWIQSVPVCLLLGFFLPSLWLRGLKSRRGQAIRLAMAPAVDLISIAVEAGLDFIAALSRYVGRGAPGPLTDEFKRVIHEIKIGSSREEALEALGRRVDEACISSFAAVLIQADRLGTSIVPALKAQAEKLRTERFQAAEKLGAAASQKILFPLVFFIIPSVFVVIFAPIVLQFLRGGLRGVVP